LKRARSARPGESPASRRHFLKAGACAAGCLFIRPGGQSARLRIREADIHLIDLRTRFPFRYGIATMTRAPHALVRVRLEVGGRISTGLSADHLPPRWFTKNRDQRIREELADLLRVIEHAVEISRGLSAESPFSIWREIHGIQSRWGVKENLPPLLTGFGVSLVERALMEAAARAWSRPLGSLLRENRLGIRLGEIHPELKGLSPASLLPTKPRNRIIARHTVGLGDPLLDSDIPPAGRLGDGLPQSLEECIRTYGLRHFKIKISYSAPSSNFGPQESYRFRSDSFATIEVNRRRS